MEIQADNKSGLLNKVIHQHVYEDKGDAFVCICGKRKLKLKKTDKEGLMIGTKSDGKPYLVRDHRIKFFMPDQWKKIYNGLKKDKQSIFDLLIQTGCRITEALHVRPKDFDFDRDTLRLWKTKTKAKKNERSGKPRTITLSPFFMKRVKKYIKEAELDLLSDEYLFRNEKGIQITKQGVSQLFKRTMKNVGIDEWDYSLHNIRKTHGNWIRAIGFPAEEVCLRLGHDFNTYLKHYGSADVFNNMDLVQIDKILEGIKKSKRSY